MEKELCEKLQSALEWFSNFPGVAVAFSGGVDSTLVLALAVRSLGPKRVIALTADSLSISRHELEATRKLAASLGVCHKVFKTNEVADARYRTNDALRCYYCKSLLFAALSEELSRIRAEESREGIVVVDGTNFDDLKDERPGRQAALEHGVLSPLAEFCITKAEARELSHHLSLPTWDKPEMACLASRIPRGTPVTEHKLAAVEKAEIALAGLGCRGARVRCHELLSVSPAEKSELLARIELQHFDSSLLAEKSFQEKAAAELRSCGFAYITLDLEGYRKGGRKMGNA